MRGRETTQSRLEQKYRSLLTIGRGGMGTIEVALERSGGGFERIVALKRMLPEASKDKRKTEMFLREARLAGRLAHPNVVHAFASGELDGELFLAMEYVEGETLSAIVRAARENDGGLAPAMVAAIVADACEGLHAAHELRDASGALLNVVHRDVSPHNVMVSYEGHVKLLDFGVAKIDAESPLTRTGEVKGKVSYMSPEQAMGDPVDRRTDLFAVGAMLFECLTGEKMWGAGTDMEILRKLALEDPPRLEVAAPGVPTELARAYAKLVQRAPADRYATARAVAEDLRAFVARSGQRVDAPAIAACMARLFAREAAARQKALNDALASVAPAHVQDLRRSLAGATAPRISQLPPIPAPSQRPTAPEPMSLAPESVARKRGVVVSIAVGVVIAAGIVVATAMKARTTTAAIEPVAVSVSVSASVPASASASASASAIASASASAPARASALPTSTSRPTSTTPSLSHSARPSPTPRASSSLDVDPSPF